MRNFRVKGHTRPVLPSDLPATGSVHVGSYALDVGAPAGSFAQFEPKRESENADALRGALATPTNETGLAVLAAEKLQQSAAAVTARIDQARRLSEAAAQGRTFQVTSLSGEIDALLSLAEKLDRAGRLKEELRLLRAMHGLLAVSLRWLDLIRALRRALSTARSAGDQAGEAWALHEIGTLELAAGDATGAAEHLGESLRLKGRLGDASGRCATRHNLDSTRRDLAHGAAPSGGGLRSRLRVASALGAAVLLAFAVTTAVRGFPPWEDSVDNAAHIGPPHETTPLDAANRPPDAVRDHERTLEDGELVIRADVFLENDRDPEGDELDVMSVEPIPGQTHGHVSLAEGTVVYRPNADANGPANFRYTVADGNEGTALGRVRVTVEPVNDVPKARPNTLETTAGMPGSVEVLGNDRDVDGDELQVVRFSLGERGRASCSLGGSCMYFPDPRTSGPDTFTYTVADGKGGEAIGHVSVQVTTSALVSIGDAPVLESGSGKTAKAVFAVTLSSPTDSPVSVEWETISIDGKDAATPFKDFTPASGAVVFEPGQTEATITVEVIGDSVAELDERFEIHLSGVSAAELGDSVGSGTIEDDDTVE
jgi:hypothetical protein